jgi:hypothetical protein
MKGRISPELRKILNDPKLSRKFFKEYFGISFINDPTETRTLNPSDYGIKPKKKRNLWDIITGK